MCIEGVKNPEFAYRIAGVGWITAIKEWGLRIVLVCLVLAQCSGAIGKKNVSYKERNRYQDVRPYLLSVSLSCPTICNGVWSSEPSVATMAQ